MLSNERTIFEKSDLKWYDFFKNPTFLFNVLGYMCFMYITFVLLTWTQKFLQDTYNFQLSSLWYLGMVPWLGSLFTVLIGGKLSDIIKIKTGSLWIARSGLCAVSLLCTFACFFMIPRVDSYQAVLFLMMLGTAFNALPNSVYWSVVVDTEPSMISTFGGLTHGFTNLSTILGPTVTGILVATTGGYDAMFTAAAFVALFGSVAMCLVRPGKRAAKS